VEDCTQKQFETTLFAWLATPTLTTKTKSETMRVQATTTSSTSSDFRRGLYTLAHKVGVYRLTRRICAISPLIVTVLAIQGLWIWFDSTVTSKQKYKPKRPPIKITSSSPTSPFYTDPKSGQPIPYDGPARAFPKFVTTDRPYPCGALMDNSPKGFTTRTPSDEGLLYIKEMETGSTILAGIAARIAQRMTPPTSSTNSTCTVRLVPARARKFASRDRDRSFLWTFVREPVDRLVHKYYHYATHRRSWVKMKPAAAAATSALSSAAPPPAIPADITRDMISYILNMENIDYGYYLKSLSLSHDRRVNTYRTDLYEQYTRDLLDSYDFLGVSERWDESLAVLQLLLGLNTADMLYLPRPKATEKTAKSTVTTEGGDHSDGGRSSNDNINSPFASETDYYEHWNKECRPIPTAKVYMEMKEWFYSDEFEAYTSADVLVYKAVNKSLDLTIESLGRKKVEKAVKQLQKANALAQQKCSQVRFPCSSGGIKQKETDCLIPENSIGCGYKCLDEVAKTL
jgi:hypothetical protein